MSVPVVLGTSLIVEWVNVHLQGQNAQNQTTVEGPFTFQVILHNTGDIIFAYKSVPLHVMNIKDEDHPVKVGLSDAYIIDRTIFCELKIIKDHKFGLLVLLSFSSHFLLVVRRKTIYEYHRLSLKGTEYPIRNNTAIYFKAMPTCNRKFDCDTCLAHDDDEDLKVGPNAIVARKFMQFSNNHPTTSTVPLLKLKSPKEIAKFISGGYSKNEEL